MSQIACKLRLLLLLQACDLRHSSFAPVVRTQFFCLARPNMQPLRSGAGGKSGTFGPLDKKVIFELRIQI